MGPVRIRIAHATVAGEQGLVITSLDKDNRKISMAIVEIADDDTGDVLVYENGTLVSEDESDYEDCFNMIPD